MQSRAVLFDFAGTLLVPEKRNSWVAASLKAVGEPVPDHADLDRLAVKLEEAGRAGGPEPLALPPELAAAYARRDSSAERHREVYTGLLARVTGRGTQLTLALYERGCSAEGWTAYPDAAPTLAALRAAGIRVAVVSNVGFDLRPVFAGNGLLEFVEAIVQSDEVGVMKPAPEIFRSACQSLGIGPEEAVMVGDNFRADGGAVELGIPTLLLPYSPAGQPHGLDAVLRLLGVTG